MSAERAFLTALADLLVETGWDGTRATLSLDVRLPRSLVRVGEVSLLVEPVQIVISTATDERKPMLVRKESIIDALRGTTPTTLPETATPPTAAPPPWTRV